MKKELIYNDNSVYYTIAGKGNAVMLIHGFAEDSNIWLHQAGVLEAHCRLIIPDLPGSGQSPALESVSMENMADVVRAIIDAENIETVTLVGHSMGGYITLAFAEKYADRLKAFCLFHSTAFPDTEEKKETRRKSIEFIRKNGTHPFLRQATPNLFSPAFRENNPAIVNELIHQYRKFNPDALIAYYEAMMQRPGRTEVLKEFKGPILFILGRYDTAVPLKDGLEQCHLPLFSYIHILDESGHMGLWEEAPECNRILIDFLVSK